MEKVLRLMWKDKFGFNLPVVGDFEVILVVVVVVVFSEIMGNTGANNRIQNHQARRSGWYACV